MEVILRKKAMEPRTKPTLSDISPFINRNVYIELCSLHAVIGVSWSILCPTLAQPLKRFPIEEWNRGKFGKYK